MGEQSFPELVDRMLGGNRTEADIRRDGARVCLAQLSEFRRRLDLVERSIRHVANTGQEQKADSLRWRRAAAAADAFFEGMTDDG